MGLEGFSPGVVVVEVPPRSRRPWRTWPRTSESSSTRGWWWWLEPGSAHLVASQISGKTIRHVFQYWDQPINIRCIQKITLSQVSRQRSLQQSAAVWPALRRGDIRVRLFPSKPKPLLRPGQRAVPRELSAQSDPSLCTAASQEGSAPQDVHPEHRRAGEAYVFKLFCCFVFDHIKK